MKAPRRWRWGEPLGPLREVLGRGGLVAFPTESSYALGADPRSEAGVAAVYKVKERQAGKPLPVVAADLSQLEELGADLGAPAVRRLLAAWPAPLTVIVPLRQPLPAAAGRGSLGVRIPAHARLRSLLAALGTALTATSANRSGEAPILAPGPLEELLAGADAVVVEGGELPGGPPSTVVRAGQGGLEILRPGSYPVARLRELAGGRVFSAAGVEIPADRSS